MSKLTNNLLERNLLFKRSAHLIYALDNWWEFLFYLNSSPTRFDDINLIPERHMSPSNDIYITIAFNHSVTFMTRLLYCTSDWQEDPPIFWYLPHKSAPFHITITTQRVARNATLHILDRFRCNVMWMSVTFAVVHHPDVLFMDVYGNSFAWVDSSRQTMIYTSKQKAINRPRFKTLTMWSS